MPEPTEPFLVVGLGASAGGISVLKEFFRHVPPTTGNAYVVILHLSPEHESLLSQILQTVATIPVAQVTERVKMKPDHVYVIAPNMSLSVVDGHLTVSDVIGFEARRAPVDIFFRTLAEAKDAHAVCVVLSGTGPNGSMGLKRVKERGGIAIAQDPGEAEFSDMPRNAVATGLIDYVLPVREIPTKIQLYQERLQRLPPTGPSDEHPSDEQIVREILAAVRAQTGHDFVQYKRGTILRRMHRRMSVHELPDLPAYRQYVGIHPEEASALLRDLLISVTNFFRDPESWAALESTIIPRLLEGRRSDDMIRVWVAGCATGEEGYSMAMALSDAVATLSDPPRFQVFATDIDTDAIAAARAGLYTNSDVADVPPERLRRYFVREGEEYRVRRELRDGMLFTVHNILRDPPFSGVDLVSCRNLLIYLNRSAQDRVMELLHFSLRPGGYLFLGGSELLTSFGDLFSVVDKDHRIAQSRAVPRRFAVFPRDLSAVTGIHTAPVPARNESVAPSHRPTQPLDVHHRLLEEYGPPSIVITEDHEIVHMSPHAGKYLHFSSGEASTNLLTLIRPELRVELRAAVYQALQQRTNVEATGLVLTGDDVPRHVNLRVRPVLTSEAGHGLLLVLFEEVAPPEGHTPAGEPIRPIEPAVRQLEEELTNLRAKLRATTQQYEAHYDEFKASNEELQAMNEELRSAGGELETSKEELQSVNEELTTVNQELKIKVEELGQANDDFRNLINSTDIATIFLDRALRVKQYTPRATDIFSLLPSDLGRPLLDLKHRLVYDGFLSDMEDVLNRLQIVEREVEGQDHTWFAMRVFPYRTSDDRLDGVVLTFVDITSRKAATEALQAAHEQLGLAQLASESALWERDLVTGAERWSPEMYQLRDIERPEDSSVLIEHESGIHPDDRGRVTAAFDAVVRQQRQPQAEWNIEFRIGGGHAPLRWIAERGKVQYDRGRPVRIMGIDFDVTHRKAAEAAQARLASIVALSSDAIVSFDFQRRIVTWNEGAEEILGFAAAEVIGRDLTSILSPEAGRERESMFEDIEAGTPVHDFATRAHTKAGVDLDVSVSASPVMNQAGTVIGGSVIIRDVSTQAEAERQIRRHTADLEQRVAERTHELIVTQEEERRRIARDLHDHLGQQLTALRLSLAVCKERAGDDETLRQHLAKAESSAMQLDADIEFLAWELRPSQLERGLVTAVDTYGREWSNHFRVAIDIHSTPIDEDRLPPQGAINIYRIAQEALNNVAKHAQATRVAVILEQRDDRIVLVIEDDGRGFDVPRKNAGSHEQRLGLSGMRERAALVSGTTHVESTPGKGTTVIVQIPLGAS
ncbi:MAG TPA: CheR family methyltransferase [Vicinamibacterales bacterium]|nr:CheR family methyltransferase [Vicinamibacterales bacterium]